MTKLTVSEIVKSCKENGGYKTPELNNILYLHYMGISELCDMPSYGPNCVWLQGNKLTKITNLMTSITCLYLQSNAICEIQGLYHLVNLKELNLNNNMIQQVENDTLPKSLENLYLSKNLISNSSNLTGLTTLSSLGLLDISHNQIQDEHIIENLCELNLSVLTTENNPFHKKIPFLRMKIIAEFSSLMYLNSKPIERDERRTVAAFFRGGKEAEMEEKSKIQAENTKSNRNQYKKFSVQHHSNSAHEDTPSSWSIEQLQFYRNMIHAIEPNSESGINIFGELLQIDSANEVDDEAVDIDIAGQPRTPFQLNQ